MSSQPDRPAMTIRRRSPSCSRRFTRPLVEQLEQRALLATLYGISDGNLLTFDSATPGTVTSAAISGLQGGETLLGIDARPSTGEIYGVGSNARLYTIDVGTGAATFVAALTATPSDQTDPYTSLPSSGYGIDFNPVADLQGAPSLRIVNQLSQNLRVDVETGLVTTDADATPLGTSILASAYSNADVNPASGTTLFGIDFTTDSLVATADPSGGVYAPVGGLGVASIGDSAFEVFTASGTNTAFAAISVNGTSSNLYTINLATGAATLVGQIGTTAPLVTGLTAAPTGGLQFTSASYAASEGTNAVIRVERIGGTSGVISAQFETSSGSATENLDFPGRNVNLIFVDGATGPATFAVPLTNDQAEGLESFTVTLTGAVALVSTSTVTIVDSALLGTAYGVTPSNQLLRFALNNPTAILSTVPITGTVGGESIVGIDFRPATGVLYGLGAGSRLYTINTATGVAAQVGTSGSFALSGSSFGFDFNPVADRIRVVSDADQNLRLNPIDGTVTADQTLNPGNPNATASAYINSFPGATTTTLYTIDTQTDTLLIQNPPNNGSLISVGPLGIDVAAVTGFDIRTVNGLNVGVATLSLDGAASQVYLIDLATGSAALLNSVGSTSTLLTAMSIVPTGVLRFSAAAYSANEDDGFVRISIERVGGTDGSIGAEVETLGGSAMEGVDFQDQNLAVGFADGASGPLTFDIPIVDDAITEGPEFFTVYLTRPDGTSTSTVVTILDVPDFDFGDAPTSYGVTLTDDGPRHLADTLYLGASIDAEFDGAPSNATSDDSAGADDEDGVALPAAIIPGVATFVTATSSAAGLLDAWIDFNRDGVFGPGEQIATSLAVAAGANTIPFTVPLNAMSGASYARFRLSSQGGLSPTGSAAGGEVEDHPIQINASVPNSATLQPDPINPGQQMVVAFGTNGNDSIQIIPRPGVPSQTRIQNNGVILGDFSNTAYSRIVIFALNGADAIASTVVKDIEAHGGAGNDSIFTGAGNDYLFGEQGDDTLNAGNGNNVVMGGDGVDSLGAGTGRDIVIGGLGADAISSGGGEDIVIGDRVTFEGDFFLLRNSLLLWTGAGAFQARVTNQAPFYNATTVAEDNATDQILGGADRDWLLDFQLNDMFLDFLNGTDRKN